MLLLLNLRDEKNEINEIVKLKIIILNLNKTVGRIWNNAAHFF